ncbi:MAG: (2Fe-2S)-binding protein [Planctomycetes bacterium]|nr:(2Fe-2S)-binding protein [Planctomycetota bacterium]
MLRLPSRAREMFNTPMARIVVADKDVEVYATPGDPILFVLFDNRVTITSVCGGHCSCGTCNIEVLEGMENINAKTECETKILSRIKRQGENVRLACQCIPTGDVVIRIVPD